MLEGNCEVISIYSAHTFCLKRFSYSFQRQDKSCNREPEHRASASWHRLLSENWHLHGTWQRKIEIQSCGVNQDLEGEFKILSWAELCLSWPHKEYIGALTPNISEYDSLEMGPSSLFIACVSFRFYSYGKIISFWKFSFKQGNYKMTAEQSIFVLGNLQLIPGHQQINEALQ